MLISSCRNYAVDEIVWRIDQFDLNGMDQMEEMLGENEQHFVFWNFDKLSDQYVIFRAEDPLNISFKDRHEVIDKGSYKLNSKDQSIHLSSFMDKSFDTRLNYTLKHGSNKKEELHLKGSTEEYQYYLKLHYSYYENE